MGITITAAGAFRETGASFFFPRRAHLLTTCKAGGGIPPFSRAVRSSRSIRRMLLQRGRQCRSVSLPSLSVRLADGLRLVCLFAANRCPLTGQPATRLRKPATGSFVAEAGAVIFDLSRLSLLRKRNRKRLEVNTIGNLPLGGEGREPWHRPICLRSLSLYELLSHL